MSKTKSQNLHFLYTKSTLIWKYKFAQKSLKNKINRKINELYPKQMLVVEIAP